MTALDHHTTLAIDARTRAVAAVARVAGGFGAMLRAIVNRRQIDRLADLSDHELADIGLRRTDLIVASRLPFGVDPTARLSIFAHERTTIGNAARRVR